MQEQSKVRRARQEADKDDVREGSGISTLQDLGRYLHNLREKMRVTQASLSTKTGAMTGRAISRSRISEIENAKRDPVSERELRVYMIGLKCTSHHTDRMAKALRHCTMTPSRETPADPVPSSPAIPDPYPARLGGAEDDITPRKEKPKDDPATAGYEEEGRERWPQEDKPTHLLDASQPQPSSQRWQRHRIAFATATALVVVASTGLGARFFLRQESGNQPTPASSPPALLVPPHAPLIPERNPNSIKNGTSPYPALGRVNKASTPTSKIQDRPAPGNTASRDTTEHPVGHCCVYKGQDQAVGVPVFSPVDWKGYAEARNGWRPDLDDEPLMEDTER
jgi:hypothetical protein